MTEVHWMERMTWFTANPYRPLPLIVLARLDGAPTDEMNLASRAGLLHQQMTGQAIETAIMIKQIVDLAEQGYLRRAEDGFRWEMTDLGVVISRQWVSGELEPRSREALSQDEVREWRDRVIAVMEQDAELAERAGVNREEWIMTQSQRLVEMHVLNRVLGEQRMPRWLTEMRTAGEAQMAQGPAAAGEQ